jgi:hypothetical protein
MEIRTLSNEDSKQWNDCVRTTCEGSLCHTFAWERILERRVFYDSGFLAAYDGGQISGILPLFVVLKPLKGHVMVSVTFGVYGGVVAECPEVTQRFLHAAKNLAVEKRVDSLEFRQLGKLDEPLRTTDLYNTFVSEIFDGEEKNMSAIPTKQPRMIQQGISHGLQAKIRGEEFLNEFYFVYSSSLRNLGTSTFPFVYFKHRFHDLGEQGKF